MIRADETLRRILFICLQEHNGQFPKNSRENIVLKNNIYLKCSSSGKLTKDHIKEWFDDVFFPEVDCTSKSAMLHDAWPGFKKFWNQRRSCYRPEDDSFKDNWNDSAS